MGQVVARCVIPTVGLLTGFENHGGATRLGPGTTPLAHVLSGCGNGSDDGPEPAEGVLAPRIVATYLHGPVLARNPDLADHLLREVVGSAFTAPARELVPDNGDMRAAYLGRRGDTGTSDPAGSPCPPMTVPPRLVDAGDAPGGLRRLVTLVLVVGAVVAVALALLGVRV